jgi:hypothetical protein
MSEQEPGETPTHQGEPSYAAGAEDAAAQRSHWRLDQRHGDTGWTAAPGGPEAPRYGWGGFAQDAPAPHDVDLDADYRAWRDRQAAIYDQDYAAWREAQMRRHDEEYRAWRQEQRNASSGS